MTTSFAEVAELYHTLSQEIKEKHPILKDWNIKWNSRLKTVMGRAVLSKGTKSIELSIEVVRLNINTPHFLQRIKETILHEWAHALDWEHHKGWGHGPTWRMWMVTLGIKPERCFDASSWLVRFNKMKYAIRHDSGRVFKYFRDMPTDIQKMGAKAWATARGLTTNQLSLIHLNDGWSREL
jgi:predicted SprT family Zn-dependent metalloprotease